MPAGTAPSRAADGTAATIATAGTGAGGRSVDAAKDGAALVANAAILAQELAAGSIERDLNRVMPMAEATRLRAMGLQAARVPKRYGGPEASFVQFAQMMMHLGEGDPNLAQMLQPHFVLLDWLAIDGSDALRKRFYADVLGGHIITNALTERGGKTPSEIRTRLSRDGNGYRLNGVKFYSTGSLIADQLYVLAMLDEDTHAIAIVPKDRRGVQVIDDWDGMGQRTTGSGTTKLDNVEVSAEEVMPLPLHGKKRSYLGAASQIAHAAIDAGIALAALKDGVLYGRTKARPPADAGVDRAADDPYVQQAVGEMSVLARSAEAMVLRGGAALDEVLAIHDKLSGEALEQAYAAASIAVAEAKAAANDASLRVSEMLFRVAGASATLRKYGLDRHWRNARTHTTHDPVAYKYRAIGRFMLSDTLPPINTKI